MPRAWQRKLVFAVPHHSAACWIDFTAMPVTSAVRCGVQSRTCAATASNPTVWFAMNCVIEPVVLDHQMQDAVEERGVAARLDRQEQVAGPRDRRDARIDDDDLGALLAGLPDVVGRDRRALGDVGAAHQDHVGAEDVVPGIGGAVDPERLLVAGRGAHHAQPAVVVDVRRAQAHVGELAHQVGLLGGQARAGQQRERVPAVCGLDAIDLRGRSC